MIKLFRTVALFLALSIPAANAFMPTYPDDDEFRKCDSVTNNVELCQREQIQRILIRVKKLYQYILSDPTTLEWTGSSDKNIQTVRDMFDSWTAFRNRICSLSHIATKYTEPLYIERYSCTSYYMLHNEDHLKSIYKLIQNTAPKNREEFTFLKIYDHDDDYQTCITDKKKENADKCKINPQKCTKDTKEIEAECIDEEVERCTQEIKNLYKTLSKDEFLGKWNNSEDLKSGNYRDMFDSWIAYRNRMCSLSVWAYQRFYGKDAIRLNDCIQFYNREKFETMLNLLGMAHSAIDATDFTGSDGGEEEGRSIKPLTQRIDAGEGNKAETLVNETTGEVKKDTPANLSNKNEAIKKQNSEALKNKQIPSWAKH